jgi:hypothetical protein
MFYIKGVIKDDKLEGFTRKDGTPGQKRSLYIEPVNSIYPITVTVPVGKDYGQIGDKVEIEVKVYPFSFVNKQRLKAFMSVYVQEEDGDKK